ncbi:MAG: hypothetical protein U0271_06660 [Polyangiaceae bacterium]
MSVPYFNYLIRHGLAVRARVAINGFVLVDGESTLMNTHTGVANHYLVPGENRLSVSCFGDPDHKSARLDAAIRDEDKVELVSASWTERPADGTELGPLGWHFHKVFTIPSTFPRPLYLAAPPAGIPEDGTPELADAVLELRGAFERGDPSAAISLFELKSHDTHKMLETSWSEPSATEALLGGALSGPWDMAPIHRRDLVFRTSCDDRLVHVSRASGDKVLQGNRRGQEKPSVASDLTFMRWQNRWRVIR